MRYPLHSARLVAVLAAGVLLAACASAPVPTTQLAASTAAYESARGVGAQQLAPAEFALAQQKIEQAQLAIKAGENERARRLAEEAEADARLASALAASARSQAAIDEIQQSLQTLQEELRWTQK
jgi:predicted outer membrane protein